MNAFLPSKMKPINSIVAYINIFFFKSYKHRIFIIFFFFIYVFSINIVHATTVIVIRTPKGIFLGADSKEGGGDKRVCKIIQANNIFFAFAGKPFLRRDNHFPLKFFDIREITTFDALSIAEKAGNVKGTVFDQINYFDGQVKAILEDQLGTLRLANRIKFDRMFKHPPLVAIIAGIENGLQIVAIRTYRIDISSTEELRIRIEKADFKDAGIAPNFGVIGNYDAITPEIKQKRVDLADPVKVIQKWITLQASADTNVSLPIDILLITLNSAEWIQHKPECPEIDQKFFKH